MITNDENVLRLIKYKNALRQLKKLGLSRVFSDNIAEAAGVLACQVRKDFMDLDVSGQKRGGYQVDDVLACLNHELGKDDEQKFILIGIGSLGSALLNNDEFAGNRLKIVAGFDINPTKVNAKGKVPILLMDELSQYLSENDIELAIITVPESNTQEVYQKLVKNNIKGIVNFSPLRIATSDEVIVNNVNLVSELENLIYYVRKQTLNQ